MSSIDFIFIYLLMFFIFYIFCKKSIYCNSNSSFWKLAIIPITYFIIVEGCRYGRGVDYFAYKYRFEHIFSENENQKLFLWLMQTLKSFGFNYVGAFMTYALIFISCNLLFIRNTFKNDDAKWIYIIMLLSMLIKSENLIRQYIALPIVFASFGEFFNKRWFYAILLLFIAMNIHSGTIILYPFVLFFYFFYKKSISPKYTIPLLIIVYYIIPAGTFSDVGIKFLNFFNLSSLGNEGLNHYIDDPERWFGADSFLEGSKQTQFTKTLQFIFDASTILISYKALRIKYNSIVNVFFNIISIGFILERSFYGYEIYQRMTGQLYIMWFVPLGYSLSIYNKLKWSKEKYQMILLISLAIGYQIFYYGRFIFLNPEAMFIWS